MPAEESCSHQWRKTGAFWQGKDEKGRHLWGPVVKCNGECRRIIHPTEGEWEKLQENPQMELKLKVCEVEEGY